MNCIHCVKTWEISFGSNSLKTKLELSFNVKMDILSHVIIFLPEVHIKETGNKVNVTEQEKSLGNNHAKK